MGIDSPTPRHGTRPTRLAATPLDEGGRPGRGGRRRRPRDGDRRRGAGRTDRGLRADQARHVCVVLEADPKLVGGISRTDQYKGYRFDIGGHRFFSKSDEVNTIWREILGDQFITRSRMSRIYYNRKFFHYPLKPADALLKLGAAAVGPAS